MASIGREFFEQELALKQAEIDRLQKNQTVFAEWLDYEVRECECPDYRAAMRAAKLRFNEITKQR